MSVRISQLHLINLQFTFNSYIHFQKLRSQQMKEAREESPKKQSPKKGLIQLVKISSLKNKQANEIQLTKNEEEDAQVQPVLASPSVQTLSCPKCNYQGNMNRQYKMGCVSWTWFTCLLLTTFIFFPIVFFVESCKDVIIYCPMCGQAIDRQFARCL